MEWVVLATGVHPEHCDHMEKKYKYKILID
jgi:hypothetical protein